MRRFVTLFGELGEMRISLPILGAKVEICLFTRNNRGETGSGKRMGRHARLLLILIHALNKQED